MPTKDTILYYPTIKIPSGSWLRQAVLYWDEVGSIVPRAYDDWADDQAIARYSGDIQYLHDQGAFRPFNPEVMLKSGEVRRALFRELDDAIDAREFRRMLPKRSDRRYTANVYKQKMTDGVFERLKNKGLAKDPDRHGDLYHFEPTAAKLYMSLLAKHFAQFDADTTATGTDKEAYLTVSHRAGRDERSEPVGYAKLRNVLLVPGPDVSFKKIIKFRRKYRPELLKFRRTIGSFSKQYDATDQDDREDFMRDFARKVERDTLRLGRAMRGSRWSLAIRTFKAFWKASPPKLLGLAGAALGVAATPLSVPIALAFGTAVTGAIDAGIEYFKAEHERNAKFEASPFSYLYLAQRKLR